MKYIITILILLNISCVNNVNTPNKNAKTKKIIDSIKNETHNATILFHHQVEKKSIVEKLYQNKKEIDSLFSIIGTVNYDTTCLRGGLFNHFGEIVLFKDALLRKPIAELHFVINGNCEGIYLETDNNILRFNLTKSGKEFILKLYNPIKNKLK
jgi:hypothetical protein